MNQPAEGAPTDPRDDFEFTITAVWREWTGGRLTEEAAMTAIGDALTELREQKEAATDAHAR